MQKLLSIRLLTVISSAALLGLAACNVGPQPPMPESPTVMRQPGLRTTAAGAVGRTNFFLSNGKKSSIDAMWGMQGYSNTKFVLDAPVVFATECDPTKIQYQLTWVLLGDSNEDLEKAPLAADPTTSPFTGEIAVNYDLRVHVSNIDTCQRIAFKFNVFETTGYTPLTKSLQVSAPGNVQVNTVQAKAVYIRQTSHLFTLDSTKAQTFAIMSKLELAQSTATACQNVAQFSLQTTDSNKNVVITPIGLPGLADLTADVSTFTTDPTKTNALLVTIQKVPGCQNEPYSFGVKEVVKSDPLPGTVTPTSPDPVPGASPVPSPTAAP